MIQRLALRRIVLVILLAAGSVAAVWQHTRMRGVYPHLAHLTGWLLLALMVALTFYNGRKKLPFLPLLSSRVWLQIHIYAGLFSMVLFVLHLNWRLPSGWFEVVLAWMFLGVTVSGIFGWWLSRMMPKRMTTEGGEVLYERIPIIRRDLRRQAEALVLNTIPEAHATTLAEFYTRDLSEFFEHPQGFLPSLAGSRRRLAVLLGDLAETKRFLTAAEKVNADKLANLIRQKDAVDFQRASQLLLRGWLFFHIPLTYSLLIFSGVHVLLIYAFSGGAR